jgi:hypothetical protein
LPPIPLLNIQWAAKPENAKTPASTSFKRFRFEPNQKKAKFERKRCFRQLAIQLSGYSVGIQRVPGAKSVVELCVIGNRHALFEKECAGTVIR